MHRLSPCSLQMALYGNEAAQSITLLAAATQVAHQNFHGMGQVCMGMHGHVMSACPTPARLISSIVLVALITVYSTAFKYFIQMAGGPHR